MSFERNDQMREFQFNSHLFDMRLQCFGALSFLSTMYKFSYLLMMMLYTQRYKNSDINKKSMSLYVSKKYVHICNFMLS